MKDNKPLHYSLLRNSFNPQDIPFKYSSDLERPTNYIGQKRAVNSLKLGMSIAQKGYNIFALGKR